MVSACAALPSARSRPVKKRKKVFMPFGLEPENRTTAPGLPYHW
jgi:hypothetical protein